MIPQADSPRVFVIIALRHSSNLLLPTFCRRGCEPCRLSKAQREHRPAIQRVHKVRLMRLFLALCGLS